MLIVITFFGLHGLSHLGWFEVKKVKFMQIIPLVFAFCGFVVFNNLSLQYNSVGVYQLMKVLTTPVIAVVQTLFYDAPLDNRLKLALLPVCIGVGLATVNDLELNGVGLTYAVLGLVSTSFYQIWVKTRQQDLGLNSYQLLYYQAPLSAVVVLFLVPIFDQIHGTGGLLEYTYNIPALFDISLTAVLAFCVNISIYLVIGNTSPISYNVLGHFKLCVILLSGWLFFQEDMNSRKMFGTILAFTGVVAYTTLKQYTDNEWNRAKPPSSTTSTTSTSSSTQYSALPSQPVDRDGDTSDDTDVEMRGKK